MDTEAVINPTTALSSASSGYRFPREVIAVAVHWYLRYGLSYRDVEELLAERGITVDHVTIYRWEPRQRRARSRVADPRGEYRATGQEASATGDRLTIRWRTR